MSSTYSPNLAIELIGTGDQAGAWGNTTNTNLGTLIEQAISGYVTQAVSTGATTTITIPNGATGVARNMYIELTGTGGTNTFLEVPSNKKLYFIYNNSSGAVTVRVSGQTGVAVAVGEKKILASNGTDVVEATTYIISGGSGNLTTLSVTSANITTLTGTTFGDTGTTNLRGVSGNITTLTGSVFGTTASTQLRGASANITIATLGAATVTTLAATSGSVTNLTVTSATVTTLGVTSAAITTISGASATYTNATVTNASLTSLTVSNPLAVTSGGTGATSATNARTNLGLAIGTDIPSPTGTGASGTWGISISGNAATATNGVVTTGSYSDPSWITALAASKLTGTVAVANGGTALSSTPTNGQLLIGNGSGYTLATLTAGTGISITNGGGSISIATTGGGDVTGPANSTDNAIARFDGATGKIIQNSGVTINDSGVLTTATDASLNGATAGIGTGGNTNTVFGVSVGLSASGNFNTFFGRNAGANIGASSANTFVGYFAGTGPSTGGLNTAMGDSAYSFGNYQNSTCLGYDSSVTGSNQVQLGNSSTTTYAYGAVQDRSDARDKADIQDTNLGTQFVMALKPRMFRWDMREDYRPPQPKPPFTQQQWDEWQEACKLSNLTHNGTHKRVRFHQGLVAQEVKQVMDQMGVDFGGYQDHSINGGDAILSIGYEELIPPLIKALQELRTEFDEYKRTHP